MLIKALQAALFLVAIGCATAKSDAPTSTRSPAVTVVQNQLDAYNKQDLEAFLKTYADDVVVTGGGKVVVQGKEALRERYQKLFAKYPKNHAEIAERRVEGDNIVVDHEIVTGRSPDARPVGCWLGPLRGCRRTHQDCAATMTPVPARN